MYDRNIVFEVYAPTLKSTKASVKFTSLLNEQNLLAEQQLLSHSPIYQNQPPWNGYINCPNCLFSILIQTPI